MFSDPLEITKERVYRICIKTGHLITGSYLLRLSLDVLREASANNIEQSLTHYLFIIASHVINLYAFILIIVVAFGTSKQIALIMKTTVDILVIYILFNYYLHMVPSIKCT